MAKHGTFKGSLNPNAGLDEDDVKLIKTMLLDGMSQKSIADKFGVLPTRINKIAGGKTWKHICDNVQFPTTYHHSKNIGSSNHNAKLDEVSVSHIKWHLGIGVASILIQKYFKISRSSVNRIRQGTAWSHVKPAKPDRPLLAMIEYKKPIRLRGDRLQAKFDERRKQATD